MVWSKLKHAGFLIVTILCSVVAYAGEPTPDFDAQAAERSLQNLQKIASDGLMVLQPQQAKVLVDELGRMGRWGISKGLFPNAIGFSASTEFVFGLFGVRNDFKVMMIPHGDKINVVTLDAPGGEVGIGAGGFASGGVSLSFNMNDSSKMDGFSVAASAAIAAIAGTGAMISASVYPSDGGPVKDLIAADEMNDFNGETRAWDKLIATKRTITVGVGMGVGAGGKVMAIVSHASELKRITISDAQVANAIKGLIQPNNSIDPRTIPESYASGD